MNAKHIMVILVWEGLLCQIGPQAQDAEKERNTGGSISQSVQSQETSADAELRDRQSKDRGQRLHAWMAAMLDWYTQTGKLTAEQQKRMETISLAEIELSQEQWRQNQHKLIPAQVPDYTPIEMTGADTLSDVVSHTILQMQIIGQLTEDQRNTLERAAALQLDAQSEDFSNYQVATIHERLRLTAGQRVLLESEFLRSQHDFRLFCFESEESPLTSLSKVSVAVHLHEIDLNAKQKAACMQLGMPGQAIPIGISIDISESEEAFRSELNQIAAYQKLHLENEIEAVVAAFAHRWNLTEKQTSLLRLAGKGAMIKCLNAWKAEAEKRFLPMIREQPPVARQGRTRLVEIQRSTVLAHPIWLQAFNSVQPPQNEDEEAVLKDRRTAIVGLMLVVLEKELWLLPEQREQFREVIAKLLPNDVAKLTFPGRELAILASLLQGITDNRSDVSLTPVQWNALEQMMGQFQYEGNSVKIKQNNGNWLTLRLP